MLSPQVREVIERETSTVHLPAGQNLFLQGDPGDAFYIVLSGRLHACVSPKNGAGDPVADPQQVVQELGQGDCFGELVASP